MGQGCGKVKAPKAINLRAIRVVLTGARDWTSCRAGG
jgi:hypothetical protein